MLAHSEGDEPIAVYYSYALQDRDLLARLDKHLASLQRQRQIVTWHDGQIEPGRPVEQEIAQHLAQAQIVLLLMSPDYIATDYCYRQMEQLAHISTEKHIVLVLLRPTPGWEQTAIKHLPPLPMRNRPITSWANRDEAFRYVADEVGRVIELLIERRRQMQASANTMRLNPPQLHSTILQREALTQAIYSRLLAPDISTIVLIGLKGVGKSTLAAQLFHYTEELRLRGKSPFVGETLWLKIEATKTIRDVIATIAEALGQLPQDFRYLFSPHQHISPLNFEMAMASELFKLVTQNSGPRLIIMDQFEAWLDVQTGKLLEQHAAIAAWLNLMNTHTGSCRILLTSSIYPQTMPISPPMYMQEFHLDGLETSEGTALLRLWGIQGSDRDLRHAVERCEGHPLALMLLERLVRNHHLKLATILNAPVYQALWMQDMQHNLLDYIYVYLLPDATQHYMLQALSIYREAVHWQAIHTIIQKYEQVTEVQTLTLLNTLQQHSLLQLQSPDDERYALHPLVADFIRERDNLPDSIDKQQAHLEAAHYYEHAFQSSDVEKHRQVHGLYLLVEAVWHYLQAGQWQAGYTLMERERLFADLHRRGENALLLDLHLQFLHIEKWQIETTQIACLYSQLGEIYFELGQPRNAQHCFEEALAFYRTAGIWEGEVNTLNNLGTTHRWSGNSERALTCYREAEQLCQNHPQHRERGITLNNLGRTFQYQGQKEGVPGRRSKYYRQALRSYQQAIAIYEACNDSAEMARTLNNMGEVYEQLQQREQSYIYYRRALHYFRELDEKRGEGIVCNNLGVLYRKQDGRKRSFEYYLQALRIFRAIGDRWQEGITLRNIGRLYIRLRRRDIALACFLLAKDAYEELRHPEHGAIPGEMRLLLSSKEELDKLIEELHPRAFQVVEDALKNDPSHLL